MADPLLVGGDFWMRVYQLHSRRLSGVARSRLPASPLESQQTGRRGAPRASQRDLEIDRTGQLVQVAIRDASPFTLFGEVITTELVGVAEICGDHDVTPSTRNRRIGLPML